MSIDLEGKKCAVCTAYLFPEDDVVFCPTCGAPHHRDCYKAKGDCGFGELHGTPEQYDSAKETQNEQLILEAEAEKNGRTCPFCHREVDEDARFCPYCRSPLMGAELPPVFPSFEVIDAAEELEDGVTVGEAAEVVAVNSIRYIPRFRAFKEKGRLSWNWAAFLMPHGWYAFRKMYLISAVIAALMIAASLFTVPMLLVEANSAAMDEAKTYSEFLNQTMQLLGEAGAVPVICSVISLVIDLGTRICSALYADYSYKNRVIESAKAIKEAEDREAAVKKYSSVSLLGFGVALAAETFLLQIIASFLM